MSDLLRCAPQYSLRRTTRTPQSVLSHCLVSHLIIFIFITFFTGCAREQIRKPTGRQEAPERTTREAPQRTVNPQQRRASQSLVEKGLAEYHAGELGRAMHYFQDAITVDGQNGEAYYYAAQVCLESDNRTDAVGFLDKAEMLFADDEAWLAKIQKLRELMDQ